MLTANWSTRTTKNQVKVEQYCCRNNMDISGIPNSISGKILENTVISICRFWSGDRSEGYWGLSQTPLSRSSRGQENRVIIKFVDWKHSEALLRDKKRISSRVLII